MRNSSSTGMCLTLALLGWFGFSTAGVPGEPPPDKGKGKMALTAASYDPETNTLFFGTDVNTAPRPLTADNPKLHTEDSCALVALDAATAKRKWSTQITSGEVWTNSMSAYDPKTGLYKDQSIGDTPKIFTLDIDGKATKVVGAGCKNGGFYILQADNGKIVKHTPLYTGAPTNPPEKYDPRVLALPSPMGGLQTGCATDGHTVYTNGIDALLLGTLSSPLTSRPPTGGRVTATSIDLTTERWRHERPKIPEMGGKPGKPMYRDVGDVGDVVASGIAVDNGVVYFTAVASGKLIALDTATGAVLTEITIGPVFAGPSLSRGRVYVGGGNTLFTPSPFENFFPKKYTGSVQCFGLPGADAADKPTRSDNDPHFNVPDDVTFRTADILSEGTRMAAEVFAPKKPKTEKLPTIIMSHGWGGTAALLRPDAIAFAQVGYLVIAFDYRGWGSSDSRLILAGGKPERKDGKLMAEVKEVREVVDPIDQTTDILNAIHWAAGEKQCDPERIGLWGSSLSGGHVVYVAARDSRVKAFVSQVGSMDGRWVTANPEMRKFTFSRGTARTRGQISYPKPGAKFGKLTGAPVIEKFIGYAPIADIGYLYFTAITSSSGEGKSSVYSVSLRKELPTLPARKQEEDRQQQVQPSEHPLAIDLERIGERVRPLPVSAGNYVSLSAASGGILFLIDSGGTSPFDRCFCPLTIAGNLSSSSTKRSQFRTHCAEGYGQRGFFEPIS